MQKVKDYRTHAQECRDLAARAGNETDRQMLLDMAATWDSLAQFRLEELQRKERGAFIRPIW